MCEVVKDGTGAAFSNASFSMCYVRYAADVQLTDIQNGSGDHRQDIDYQPTINDVTPPDLGTATASFNDKDSAMTRV